MFFDALNPADLGADSIAEKSLLFDTILAGKIHLSGES